MVNLNIFWKDTPTSRIVHLVQVSLQFIAALLVIGLNASDVADGPTDRGASVVAMSVATLSAITVIFFAIDIFYPFPSRLWLLWVLFWQWVLTLAWTGVVSAFGKRYFDDSNNERIQAAAGINVANLLLWLFGSVVGTVFMCFRRKLGGKRPDEPHELS